VAGRLPPAGLRDLVSGAHLHLHRRPHPV